MYLRYSVYRQYYAWLLGSLAISIGIQIVLPYPYGLIASVGFFMVFPVIYKKMMLKGKLGMGLEKGFAKRCGVCNHKTSQGTCPRCGSRQFKMG